jgi:hypothetical protein
MGMEQTLIKEDLDSPPKSLTLMRRAMQFQRSRRVLRVYARKATSFVSFLEIVIFNSLGQSSNSVHELLDRFPPFLAQPILFGTVAHFLTYRPPDTKSEGKRAWRIQLQDALDLREWRYYHKRSVTR